MIQRVDNVRDIQTDELIVNMGPQHPATHGVLRVALKTDGEVVLDLESHVGNLHRCKERIAENVRYAQFMPYTDRMDYLAAMNSEFAYALAVEKLLGTEVPERTKYIRVCMAELNRIASHLMSVGTYGLDMGAITPFLYAFREREIALDLMEEVSGGRMLYHYIRIGGVALDLPDGWTQRCRDLMTDMDKRIEQYNTLLTWNTIFIERTAGIGLIDKEMAYDWAITGPGLRAAGVDWDCRRDEPYSVYPELDFEVPFAHGTPEGEKVGILGDCWHRHYIRMLEMEQSVKLVRQCLDKIESMPKPEKPTDLTAKMPKLLRPPEGEVYFRAENPRGELAFYIQADGNTSPWRLKIRGPSFCNIAILGEASRGHLLADLVAIIGSIDIVLGEVDR
ncbi:MAG: NADH-quinone oxidoreductase subunit D [Planctomycetota bacterium]|jgi:NADH-quinone oxidoreductase subunit D